MGLKLYVHHITPCITSSNFYNENVCYSENRLREYEIVKRIKYGDITYIRRISRRRKKVNFVTVKKRYIFGQHFWPVFGTPPHVKKCTVFNFTTHLALDLGVCISRPLIGVLACCDMNSLTLGCDRGDGI